MLKNNAIATIEKKVVQSYQTLLNFKTKIILKLPGAVPRAPKPEELRFKTKEDGYVNIHPSSVNFQVRYYDSPYLVYHEKLKTSKVS